MPEVLRVDVLEDAPRSLCGPDPVLDPATARVLDAAVAEAEQRGRRDGEAAGRAAAAAEVERAAGAVVAALERLVEELRAQREAVTAASLELARTAAEAVLARTPADEATEVLARVTAAVQALDDDDLELRLHPDDHRQLAEVRVDPRLRLVPDEDVARGEAVVAGRFAGAELTRSALLEAALEQLPASGGAP